VRRPRGRWRARRAGWRRHWQRRRFSLPPARIPPSLRRTRRAHAGPGLRSGGRGLATRRMTPPPPRPVPAPLAGRARDATCAAVSAASCMRGGSASVSGGRSSAYPPTRHPPSVPAPKPRAVPRRARARFCMAPRNAVETRPALGRRLPSPAPHAATSSGGRAPSGAPGPLCTPPPLSACRRPQISADLCQLPPPGARLRRGCRPHSLKAPAAPPPAPRPRAAARPRIAPRGRARARVHLLLCTEPFCPRAARCPLSPRRPRPSTRAAKDTFNYHSRMPLPARPAAAARAAAPGPLRRAAAARRPSQLGAPWAWPRARLGRRAARPRPGCTRVCCRRGPGRRARGFGARCAAPALPGTQNASGPGHPLRAVSAHSTQTVCLERRRRTAPHPALSSPPRPRRAAATPPAARRRARGLGVRT
jgi:hypothetical protein